MRSAGGLSMIASLSLILLCQLAGEVIVRGFALPVPGPVVGLMLLLLLLLARDRFAVTGMSYHVCSDQRARA
jgi:putative effector of murein hydrolase LrgA (UPF0299 family)